jgi:hypothetical protein
MQKRRMRLFFIFCAVIVILLTNSSLVLAQPQSGYHPGCFFNLQFVMTVSWSGNDTQEPISPGETREVNFTISSTVTRGAFGRWLLQLLEGRTFSIRLSILDKPDWCVTWIIPANITGTIQSDQITCYNSLLFIHLNDGAPSNYTLGWVKIRCIAEDKKGPFNIFTLVHGYENDFTISFIVGL